MTQSNAQTTAAERRDEVRLKSLIAATIVYNNGQSTLNCVIRNFSETGAMLSVPAGIALPDRFDLIVPQKNQTYRAIMEWQRGDEVGVSLDGASAGDDAGGSPEAALKKRVRELEAEVTRLKSRIAQLTEG
jgi:hypothetical protein